MTDFIQILQHALQEGRERGMRPSEIMNLSMRFVQEELQGQQRQFGKRLSRVGEKAKEKMGGFARQLRESRQKIVFVMEVVQQMALLLEGGERNGHLAESLKKRIAYHNHKKNLMQREYPSFEFKKDEAIIEEQSDIPSVPNYIIKCHHTNSLEPCTPQNDKRLDQQLAQSLQELFSSLEKSLTNFQHSYGHLAGEDTNEVMAILKKEYSRARQNISQENPTLQQIQNMKELQLMVRATLQQRIYEIRQQQRKIYSQIHNQPPQ